MGSGRSRPFLPLSSSRHRRYAHSRAPFPHARGRRLAPEAAVARSFATVCRSDRAVRQSPCEGCALLVGAVHGCASARRYEVGVCVRVWFACVVGASIPGRGDLSASNWFNVASTPPIIVPSCRPSSCLPLFPRQQRDAAVTLTAWCCRRAPRTGRRRLARKSSRAVTIAVCGSATCYSSTTPSRSTRKRVR